MTKDNTAAEEEQIPTFLKKVKESKKNANDATKKKAKIETKKAADKIITETAAKVPLSVGGGKSFLALVHQLDELLAKQAALALAKRGVRAKLKEMKIELAPLDAVLRLRKMEPEDALSYKATCAIYEQQLAMPLTDDQKKVVSNLEKKRDDARKSLAEVNGGDTGKEVGSSASAPASSSAIPAKNEALSHSASAATH